MNNMEKDFIPDDPLTGFFNDFMTALFVGIADVVLCLIFNLVYRGNGIYFSSDLINVASIIFGVLLLYFLIGMIYAMMVRMLKKGVFFFILFFILLTILALWAASSVNFSVRPAESERFRGLLKGIVWIVGISAVIGIPLLRNSKKFKDYVL